MKDQYKELQEDILYQENLIEETLKHLSEVKSKFNPTVKDYFTEPAMGTYLMNFYNGVENILKCICREYYLTMPGGENWHKELLDLALNPPSQKIPVFTPDIVEKLHPYRKFRHLFISGYGFQLKGEKMVELINNIDVFWNDIKKAVSGFLDKL